MGALVLEVASCAVKGGIKPAWAVGEPARSEGANICDCICSRKGQSVLLDTLLSDCSECNEHVRLRRGWGAIFVVPLPQSLVVSHRNTLANWVQYKAMSSRLASI